MSRIKVELPSRVTDGTQQHVPATTASPVQNEQPFGFSFSLPTTTTKVGRGKQSVYPICPDPDGALARMAASYKLNKEKMEAAEAQCEELRPRITERTFPYWCKVNSGKAECSHIAIQSPEGEILCMAIDKYSPATSLDAVRNVGGPDILKYFKPHFTIKVKSDNLPESPATQTLLNELIALFTRHGQAGALEFKQSIIPRKGWVDIRHRVLSPEQNMMLNEVCPCQTQLKCRGRGGN